MKNSIPMVCSAILLLACTACKTHVPMIQREAGSYQKEAEAVQHWKAMVGQVCETLAMKRDLVGRSICLEPLAPQVSQFDAAFWKLLKVQLINRSWNLVENPRAAELVLSFESQLVTHGNRGFYCFNPTSVWSNLGYGITHFFTGDDTGDDWSTREDLLVTTFVRTGGMPVTAISQIVYVPSGDADLYIAPTSDVFANWTPAVARGMGR